MLAIISDIHDNEVYLNKFLTWSKDNKIKDLICCGDVTSGQTLKIIAKSFAGKVHLVRGNADFFSEEEAGQYDNIIYHGKVALVDISGVSIGICHEPFLFDKVKELGRAEVVFYGHTHKPWEEKKDGIAFVNPGTLGGMFQLSTFAVFDTDTKNFSLHISDQV